MTMPGKEYYSEYMHKSIVPILIRRWVPAIAFFLAMSTFFVSAINNPLHYTRRKNFWREAVMGLEYFGFNQLLFSLLGCLILSAFGVWALNYSVINKKMIVGFKIDEEDQSMIVYTRTLFGVRALAGKFNEIKFFNKARIYSDEIDTDTFPFFTLTKNNIIEGRFFVGHYTWTDKTVAKEVQAILQKYR